MSSELNRIQIPNLVSVDWLKDHLDSLNLLIFDATINKRISSETLGIPSAQFFDIKQHFSAPNAKFPSTLPTAEQFQKEARSLGVRKDSAVVVYDDKGIYSSARAWWLFKTFGFKNVAVLDGGFPLWQKKGYLSLPLPQKRHPKGDMVARLQSEFMVDFDTVKELAHQSDTLIIDARSENRFKGLVDEPRAGLRRGTIPNSKNLPYSTLFSGYELKPVVELKQIFNTLVNDEQRLVFSCGSGITACILALCACLCDYKTIAVYDGSWTEYGSLTKI